MLVLKVRVSILGSHDVLIENSLPVFDLPDAHLAFIQLSQQLHVTSTRCVDANLSFEDGLAYLDLVLHLWIVSEPWLFVDLKPRFAL